MSAFAASLFSAGGKPSPGRCHGAVGEPQEWQKLLPVQEALGRSLQVTMKSKEAACMSAHTCSCDETPRNRFISN